MELTFTYNPAKSGVPMVKDLGIAEYHVMATPGISHLGIDTTSSMTRGVKKTLAGNQLGGA